MPALNFPDPDVTPTYTEAGITWTWNATLGVWSTEPGDVFGESEADARYLRIDASAPAQTRVSGVATFAAGINATGGEGVQVTGTTTHWNRINSFPTFNRAESDEIHGIVSGLAGNTNSNDFNAFFAPTSIGNNKGDADTTVTGFRSAISFGTNQYNFYAEGDAPSYFAGTIRTGNVTAIGGNTNDEANWSWTVNNTSSNGVRIYGSSVSASLFTATGTSACFAANRMGANNGRLFDFRWRGSEVGDIRMNGAGANPTGIIYDAGGTATTGAAFIVSSDYRLKTNIVDAPSASGLIQQLQPRQFDMAEQVGAVGFVAHELQEVIPEAVVGEKDGVDEEGNPAMQGIDRSVLVPYLTKALQEALARIEQLEAAGGSELLGRVEQLERENTIDDASDNALLVLVGELASRVQQLEDAATS